MLTGALVYCRCPPCPESTSAEVHLITTHMYCNMQAPGCTCSTLHSTVTDALKLALPLSTLHTQLSLVAALICTAHTALTRQQDQDECPCTRASDSLLLLIQPARPLGTACSPAACCCECGSLANRRPGYGPLHMCALASFVVVHARCCCATAVSIS